jgi:predicted PurR-regulated permease PerM
MPPQPAPAPENRASERDEGEREAGSATGEPRVRVAGLSSTASFTNRVLILAGIVALALIAWRLSGVFLLLFAAIVLAAVFRAFAVPLARLTQLPERLALALVIVVLAGILGVSIWLLGDRVAAEFGQIVKRLPAAWTQLREWLAANQAGRFVLEQVDGMFAGTTGVPGRLANFATTTFGALADAAIIVVLAVFLAADPALYRRGLVKLVPPRGRAAAEETLDAIGTALGRWLKGQGLAMLSIGVMIGLGLWVLGIPMPLALGIFAGLMEFVPYIGAIASATPALLLAFAISPLDALYVLILFLVVQNFEGNVLVPLIQQWAVRVPAVLTLLAIVVFGILFGGLGLLVAAPLMVVAMVVVQKLYIEHTLGDRA